MFNEIVKRAAEGCGIPAPTPATFRMFLLWREGDVFVGRCKTNGGSHAEDVVQQVKTGAWIVTKWKGSPYSSIAVGSQAGSEW